MCNIICVHSSLKFLIFINIISTSVCIEPRIKIAFLNGLNLVRCSEDRLQVYQLADDSESVISDVVKCGKIKDLYDSYAGFIWGNLKLICSDDNSEVHEEQSIELKLYGEDIRKIPDIQGQLDQSTDPYEFTVKQSAGEDLDKVVSDNQPANDEYFNKNEKSKSRTIYIWFPDHPIACRIRFTGTVDNPCPTMHDMNVDDVDYLCYYNPGADELPTKNEIEAEFKQFQAAVKPDDAEAYVLNLRKPVCLND